MRSRMNRTLTADTEQNISGREAKRSLGTGRLALVLVAAVLGSVGFYFLAEQLGMNGFVSSGIFLAILLFTVVTSRSK